MSSLGNGLQEENVEVGSWVQYTLEKTQPVFKYTDPPYKLTLGWAHVVHGCDGSWESPECKVFKCVEVCEQSNFLHAELQTNGGAAAGEEVVAALLLLLWQSPTDTTTNMQSVEVSNH